MDAADASPETRTVAQLLGDDRRQRVLARVLHHDGVLPGVLDRVTDAIAAAIDVPIALIVLVDAEWQHFVGNTGITGPAAAGTPIGQSFCRHELADDGPLVIEDARVSGSPAIEELGVIAYLGQPIRVGGHVLGSVCAIDRVPRRWDPAQVAAMRRFADLAECLVSARMSSRQELSEIQSAARHQRASAAARIADFAAQADEQSAVADLSRRLQYALLGQSGTQGPFDISVFYEPGSDRLLLGGDFVATALAAEDRLDFVIGDVSGHGPEAAALAVSLRASWRALRAVDTPSERLLGVLDGLCSATDLQATLLVGSADAGGGLRIASAGHQAPIVVQGERAWELPVVPGPMLGIGLSAPSWTETAHRLDDGTLIAYTDGVIEGLVDGTRERFGTDRLLSAIERLGSDLATLCAAATRSNRGPLPDDVALLRITQAGVVSEPQALRDPRGFVRDLHG